MGTMGGTVNSEVFQDSLLDVKLTLDLEASPSRKVEVFIVDNASTHTAFQTINKIERMGLNMLFLLSYSPELNYVEGLIKLIKSQVRTEMMKKRKVNI
jgi:transposase